MFQDSPRRLEERGNLTVERRAARLRKFRLRERLLRHLPQRGLCGIGRRASQLLAAPFWNEGEEAVWNALQVYVRFHGGEHGLGRVVGNDTQRRRRQFREKFGTDPQVADGLRLRDEVLHGAELKQEQFFFVRHQSSFLIAKSVSKRASP